MNNITHAHPFNFFNALPEDLRLLLVNNALEGDVSEAVRLTSVSKSMRDCISKIGLSEMQLAYHIEQGEVSAKLYTLHPKSFVAQRAIKFDAGYEAFLDKGSLTTTKLSDWCNNEGHANHRFAKRYMINLAAEDDNPDVRSRAIKVLSEMNINSSAVLNTLVDRALHDDVSRIRINAVKALGKKDPSSILLIDTLLTVAFEDTVSAVKQAAIRALVDLPEPSDRVIQSLIDIANRQEELPLKLEVIRRLGSLAPDHHEVAQALMTLVNNVEDSSLVRQVITSLLQFVNDYPPAFDFVFNSRAAIRGDLALNEKILQLKMFSEKNPEMLKRLVSEMDNPDDQVRYAVIEALKGDQPRIANFDAILHRALQDSSSLVRYGAIRVLSSAAHLSEATLRAFCDIALNDQSSFNRLLVVKRVIDFNANDDQVKRTLLTVSQVDASRAIKLLVNAYLNPTKPNNLEALRDQFDAQIDMNEIWRYFHMHNYYNVKNPQAVIEIFSNIKHCVDLQDVSSRSPFISRLELVNKDIRCPNKRRKKVTPLDVAAYYGRLELAQILIDRHFDAGLGRPLEALLIAADNEGKYDTLGQPINPS